MTAFTIDSFLQTSQDKHDEAMLALRTALSEGCEEHDKLAGQILAVLIRHIDVAYRLLGPPWAQNIHDYDARGTVWLLRQLQHALFDDGDICFAESRMGLQLLWVSRWGDKELHSALAERLADSALYDPADKIVTMDWKNEEIPEKLAEYLRATARVEFLEEALTARTWEDVAWVADYARKKSCWDEAWLSEVDTLRPSYADKYRKLYGEDPPERTPEQLESIARLKERLQAKVAARAAATGAENPV